MEQFDSNLTPLDNAIYYSLLESCELAGVPPLQLLTHVLENLYDDTTEEQLQALLPTQLQKISRITSARFFYAIKAGLFRMVTMSTLAAHSPSLLSHTTHRKSAPEMDALLTIFKEKRLCSRFFLVVSTSQI